MAGNSPNRMSGLINAVNHREKLIADEMFSVPEGSGRVAVWFSAHKPEELDVLTAHAEALRARLAQDHEVDLLECPGFDDLIDVVRDPGVSSMVALGHGSFGSIRVYQDDGGCKHLSWYDVAKNTRHLKTGFFEQRTCARVCDGDKTVRVALGSFVMADQTRIFAPTAQVMTTNAGLVTFDRLIRPIYANPSNSPAELREPLGY